MKVQMGATPYGVALIRTYPTTEDFLMAELN